MDPIKYTSSGALPGYPEPPGVNKTNYAVVCYPIMDILKASGYNKLDVLYLDVQGPEFDILKTIDFRQIDITVSTSARFRL